MAHLQKYKSEATHAILDHCARSRSGTLERDNIDQSRTALNLTLGASDPEAGKAAILDRIKAVKASHTKITGKKVRADAVEFGDWIVTVPQSLPADLHQKFFTETFEFLQQRYGTENVPCGFVHLDESQPHMHCPVVPEKAGKLTGKAVFNRKELQSFHSDLQNHLERELGCCVEIILDEEQAIRKAFSSMPSKDFQQLDGIVERFEKLSAENERLERVIDYRQDELSDLDMQQRIFNDELKTCARQKESLESTLNTLQQELEGLENQKQLLNEQTNNLIAEISHLEAETKKLKEEKETLNAEKGRLKDQIQTLRSEVDNPLAPIILEAREATNAVYQLYGEYESFRDGIRLDEYVPNETLWCEPLESWDNQNCEVQIVKRPFKEPVVQMPLSRWETLKDAHNRLISAYKDAITTLKTKVEKLIDFLKKMPEHVPQYFKLEELHKKLARYDLMDRERYAKAAKAGREETYELTRKATNGQRVQRPTIYERLQQANKKLEEEQARQTKTKRKSRDDDLVR